MFSKRSPTHSRCFSQGEAFTVWGIPVGDDNIAWLLSHESGDTLAVDAPAAAPILRHLHEHQLRLTRVLVTHLHSDHVAGLEALLAETGCPPPVFPPDPAHAFQFRGREIRVLETSGHSPADFSYWIPDLDLCFCGDTLFAGGCGRLFAGPPARMWDSLLRLRALPDDTLLCMGHDYAVENVTFAVQTFPDLPVFAARKAEALRVRDAGEIFAPVRLGDESRGNPMLMADHPDIAAALGLEASDPVRVFTQIRELRNLF